MKKYLFDVNHTTISVMIHKSDTQLLEIGALFTQPRRELSYAEGEAVRIAGGLAMLKDMQDRLVVAEPLQIITKELVRTIEGGEVRRPDDRCTVSTAVGRLCGRYDFDAEGVLERAWSNDGYSFGPIVVHDPLEDALRLSHILTIYED